VHSIAFAIHFLNVLNSSVFIISCVCVCVFFANSLCVHSGCVIWMMDQ
jgi:hypothetical protein